MNKAFFETLSLPDPDTCPHTKVTHVLPMAGAGGTVCMECGKGWPDADDGTWTGPLKGKTPQ